jgi:hypothetical protein
MGNFLNGKKIEQILIIFITFATEYDFNIN